ncbi:MAG: helix-turn-helix domain-containing protein, partial [Pseudomonadota bacterium]
PLRYNALRRALPGVSQRMLTRAVRRLEDEGPVHRHEERTSPPRVTYSLTNKGQSFKPALENVAAWGRQYL